MNTKQENKLSMMYVVKATCEKYQTTWSANPIFTATYNFWVAKIPLIEQNRDLQMVELGGITTDKFIKRTAVLERSMYVVNRLLSYANATNNSELAVSIPYTSSGLRKARDTDFIGICNNILAKGNAHAAAIVVYGVSAAILTDLQTSITTYSASLAKPKSAKSQTKTATENLLKLFKEADDLLTKRLDLDIELFRTTKPEFYSQYKTARKVISTGVTTSAVLGKVTVANSGEPLKGVKFTFTPESLNAMKSSASSEAAMAIVKRSAEKGNFIIPNLPENSYRVTVAKIGFKEQVININVISGETTSLRVELERN